MPEQFQLGAFVNIHGDTACSCMICQQCIFSYSHPGSCLALLVWSLFWSSACHSSCLPYLLSCPPSSSWHFCLSIILAPCSLSFSWGSTTSFFYSSLSTSHLPHLWPLIRPCLFTSYKCQSKGNAENTWAKFPVPMHDIQAHKRVNTWDKK